MTEVFYYCAYAYAQQAWANKTPQINKSQLQSALMYKSKRLEKKLK